MYVYALLEHKITYFHEIFHKYIFFFIKKNVNLQPSFKYLKKNQHNISFNNNNFNN